MKNELEFTSDNKTIRVSIPYGIPSFTWDLNVDGYYWGRMEKKNGLWRSIDVKNLQADDVTAIGERIDAYLRENGADAAELEQGGFEKHRE